MQNLIYEMRRLRNFMPEEYRCMAVRRIGMAIHRSMKDKEQVLAFVRACKLNAGTPVVPKETTIARTKLASFIDKWVGAVATYDPIGKQWVPLTEDANDLRVKMLAELMALAGVDQAVIDAMVARNISDLDEVELALS